MSQKVSNSPRTWVRAPMTMLSRSFRRFEIRLSGCSFAVGSTIAQTVRRARSRFSRFAAARRIGSTAFHENSVKSETSLFKILTGVGTPQRSGAAWVGYCSKWTDFWQSVSLRIRRGQNNSSMALAEPVFEPHGES